MSERRERSYDLKTLEATRIFLKERQREEMSMRQREDNDGGEGRWVKIDEAFKKKNGWDT